MSKGLEALKRVKKAHDVAGVVMQLSHEDTETINAINVIEKELKALEIIKKYPKVPIQRLIAYEKAKSQGYRIGSLEVNDIPYTEEEYALLKEELL